MVENDEVWNQDETVSNIRTRLETRAILNNLVEEANYVHYRDSKAKMSLREFLAAAQHTLRTGSIDQ